MMMNEFKVENEIGFQRNSVSKLKTYKFVSI